MSWSISAGGLKRDVKAAVEAQGAHQVRSNYMTETQLTAVMLAVDAAPGVTVSVSASGHNDLVPEGATTSQERVAVQGTFSINVSSHQ